MLVVEVTKMLAVVVLAVALAVCMVWLAVGPKWTGYVGVEVPHDE
jgi:hypothetical protein